MINKSFFSVIVLTLVATILGLAIELKIIDSKMSVIKEEAKKMEERCVAWGRFTIQSEGVKDLTFERDTLRESWSCQGEIADFLVELSENK